MDTQKESTEIKTAKSIDIPASNKSFKVVKILTWLAVVSWLIIFAKVSIASPLGFAAMLTIFIGQLMVLIYISRTANAHGRSGIVWAGLSFITIPIGSIIAALMLAKIRKEEIFDVTAP
ncbi:hypothetical protein LCGC14_0526630 [marine sediment metagenome]|uniref:Uncharacterized protein n=1 Tax=marine sediment metagenome TaxID=412755 RepID=A0A0F9V513_9ZZZZ|nr:hypothetical protein [Methylophaga sp.]HEC59849.1 hypothetical protein [Methylophaga sp.]